MGNFFWCYQRVREGEFVRVPARVYDPFLRGRVSLPNGGEAHVRLVFIAGPSESRRRRPVQIHTLEFAAIEVDSAGLHTEELQLEAMR